MNISIVDIISDFRLRLRTRNSIRVQISQAYNRYVAYAYLLIDTVGYTRIPGRYSNVILELMYIR